MNTNSNVYTVIYTTIVCVVVAAILAFVSQSLKDRQEANEKAENISQILTAAQFGEKSSWTDNNTTINFYKENIDRALLVNAKGETVKVMDASKAEIYTVSDLKKQNYNVNGASGELEIPVYIFKNGVSVLPLYGAGLWGPVWGYVALENDLRTIKGAYFDHSSELLQSRRTLLQLQYSPLLLSIFLILRNSSGKHPTPQSAVRQNAYSAHGYNNQAPPIFACHI